MTLVRFTADDLYGAWRGGDLADELGPESPEMPMLRVLRLHADGQVLVITSPYDRGLIEPVETPT